MAGITQEELLSRISQGEDGFTELKEKLPHPDDLACDLVAFANTRGGLLILGVSDDRQFVGLPDHDAALRQVDNVALNNVEPPLSLEQKIFQIEGKTLVAVLVPQSHSRPHRTNKGVYYIRTGSGRRQASRDELRAIYQSAGAIFTEEIALPGSGQEDIDLEYLFRVRPRLAGLPPVDLDRALRYQKILREDGLTIFGAVCFSRDVDRVRPYASITFLRFPDAEMGERFDFRRDFTGPIGKQLEDCFEFLFNGPLMSAAEWPLAAIPREAVQEAVVNAVAHRDYFINSQVRIFLTPQYVEVRSPGRLLNTITIEALQEGGFVHAVRNPLIFAHLSNLGWTTNAGQGIRQMLEAMEKAGLPKPGFSQWGPDFMVRLSRA